MSVIVGKWAHCNNCPIEFINYHLDRAGACPLCGNWNTEINPDGHRYFSDVVPRPDKQPPSAGVAQSVERCEAASSSPAPGVGYMLWALVIVAALWAIVEVIL